MSVVMRNNFWVAAARSPSVQRLLLCIAPIVGLTQLALYVSTPIPPVGTPTPAMLSDLMCLSMWCLVPAAGAWGLSVTLHVYKQYWLSAVYLTVCLAVRSCVCLCTVVCQVIDVSSM